VRACTREHIAPSFYSKVILTHSHTHHNAPLTITTKKDTASGCACIHNRRAPLLAFLAAHTHAHIRTTSTYQRKAGVAPRTTARDHVLHCAQLTLFCTSLCRPLLSSSHHFIWAAPSGASFHVLLARRRKAAGSVSQRSARPSASSFSRDGRHGTPGQPVAGIRKAANFHALRRELQLFRSASWTQTIHAVSPQRKHVSVAVSAPAHRSRAG
jgi:hypothetical protein